MRARAGLAALIGIIAELMVTHAFGSKFTTSFGRPHESSMSISVTKARTSHLSEAVQILDFSPYKTACALG
jgi:hypothetical protein